MCRAADRTSSGSRTTLWRTHLVGQAEHAVERGHGLGETGELDQHVVTLTLVVHLVGEGASTQRSTLPGCPAAPRRLVEGTVEHPLDGTAVSAPASKMTMTS